MDAEAWAPTLARELLSEALPDRWAHTQGVAAQARALRPILGDHPDDAATIEAAAWLHDVGYSPALVHTGFHPLDGARHLRDHDLGSPLVRTLVAHHSCALIEAEERGLRDTLLAEFATTPEADRLSPALLYADMTTGPTGDRMSVDDRLAEILRRYPRGHVVHDAMERARPRIRHQCATVASDLGLQRTS
jgi:HD superfamily phosphohydrolase